MGRAISLTQLYSTKRKTVPFDGKWLTAIGLPELKGSWLLYGPSRNGKTAFAIQLAQYLSQWSKVYYNSLEEGDSLSLTAAFRRQGVSGRRIIILNKEPIAKLKERLKKKKAARIVINDSAQYTFLKIHEYFALKEEFPNVLFIWISHEKGGNPKGALAEAILYDADVKIRVKGYRAFVGSRFLEGEAQTIDVWPEKAAEFYPLEAIGSTF